MCSIVNIDLSAFLDFGTQVAARQGHGLVLTIVNNPGRLVNIWTLQRTAPPRGGGMVGVHVDERQQAVG